MAKITVYHFKTFDVKTRGWFLSSPKMATRELIATIRSGEPIMETAMEMELDANGFFTRPISSSETAA